MNKTKNLPVKIEQAIKESNITDLSKVEKIASGYAPLMAEVNEQIQLLKQLEKGNTEDVVKAKRIRIDLGKICSEASKQKKDDKDLLLVETRFIDKLYGVVDGAARITQSEAKEIELHAENIEKERVSKLEADRKTELEKFDVDFPPEGLGLMSTEVWDNYLSGTETAHSRKLEAEEKAEAERVAALEAAKVERERVEKENIELKKQAQERERLQKIEDDKRSKAESERIAKETAERKQREEKEAAERKVLKEKQRKEREAYEAKLKVEREEKQRIEAELQAKRAAEERTKEEAEEKKQKELNKGDSAKVKDLITDLENVKSKYKFKSKKNQKMFTDVQGLIDKVTSFINN